MLMTMVLMLTSIMLLIKLKHTWENMIMTTMSTNFLLIMVLPMKGHIFML